MAEWQMVTHVARHFARDVGHHTRAPGSVRNQGVDTVMNCYHHKFEVNPSWARWWTGWNDTRPAARALVLERTNNRCQVRALI